jgi:hypothetical protein
MDQRIWVLALAVVGGCNQRDSGSFETQGDNLVEWSQRNPYVSEQTWAGVQSLKCEVKSAKRCGPKDCVSFKPTTFVRWHPADKKYERCGGSQPCDVYTPEVSYSGAFANIAFPQNGFMARLTASGEFVEVLTQMDAVLVYHGQCTAER